MQCRDIIRYLEVLSPVGYAADWDNVGLLLGREEKEVRKVMVAVDATEEVIDHAITWGADMLITHHPLIFKPLKRICADDFIGKRVLNLLQEDICYYAMHTNFDVMGMADAAADKIQLRDRQVLEVTYEDAVNKEGYGRYGRLPKSMTLEECARFIKEAFEIEGVLVYGELHKNVEIAAISPGSVKSVVEDAVAAGVDVLISGDFDHHTGIDLVARGVTVIDAGHYGLEKIFVPYMKEYLSKQLPQLTVETEKEKCPYKIV